MTVSRLGGEEGETAVASTILVPLLLFGLFMLIQILLGFYVRSVASAAATDAASFLAQDGVTAGQALAGLGMDVGNIAAACVLATLLGVLFGLVALAISAATGQVRSATFGTAGLAVAAYVTNSVLSIGGALAPWTVVSPFDWYLGSEPLVNGMAWGDAALLTVAGLSLLAYAVMAFERRDLRQG